MDKNYDLADQCCVNQSEKSLKTSLFDKRQFYLDYLDIFDFLLTTPNHCLISSKHQNF